MKQKRKPTQKCKPRLAKANFLLKNTKSTAQENNFKQVPHETKWGKLKNNNLSEYRVE